VSNGRRDLGEGGIDPIGGEIWAIRSLDRRQIVDPWAAMDDLLADRFADRGISLRPSWGDFPQIHALVRAYLSEYGHRGFRRTWPRIAEPLVLDAADDKARWEARCLGELAWLCVRGVGDSGFAVWDTGKFIRHRTRLRRLDLPVPDHHAPDEQSVRAALLWTDADLARWERLLASTGRLSAPAALAAAVSSLVGARSGDWLAVARDPDRLGTYSLTRPDGEEIRIDLVGDRERQVVCRIEVRRTDRDQPEPERWVAEYADPQFLVVLAGKLRDLGLDSLPPVWPVNSPGQTP
jgi:hypothetical protein